MTVIWLRLIETYISGLDAYQEALGVKFIVFDVCISVSDEDLLSVTVIDADLLSTTVCNS